MSEPHPLLVSAIFESADIVVELARLTPGRKVLSFYVALLRLAKTMEVMYSEFRPLREAVLADVDAKSGGMN